MTAMDEEGCGAERGRSEFQLWHVYDAGDVEVELKVRYQDNQELPAWRRGPDLATALRLAGAEGWQAYDSEPGDATGEHAIVHLKRSRAR